MYYIAPLFTVLLSFCTIFCKKPATASFSFLLACSGFSACLFQLKLIPFCLILLFSVSFWLLAFFLFDLILSKKMKTVSFMDKKTHLIASSLFLSLFISIATIYIANIQKPESSYENSLNFFNFLREHVIENFPLLFSYSLVLIATFIAALFIFQNPSYNEGSK